MAVKLSTLRTGRDLLPRIIFLLLVLISVRACVKLQGLVQQKGLGKFKKKFVLLIGFGTRYLAACGIVLQPLRHIVQDLSQVCALEV
jgi:hypothetical protein